MHKQIRESKLNENLTGTIIIDINVSYCSVKIISFKMRARNTVYLSKRFKNDVATFTNKTKSGLNLKTIAYF